MFPNLNARTTNQTNRERELITTTPLGLLWPLIGVSSFPTAGALTECCKT